MRIITRYRIYELNKIMGSDKHLALEKVSVDWDSAFDSEELALKALIDNEKTNEEYLILKTVELLNY